MSESPATETSTTPKRNLLLPVLVGVNIGPVFVLTGALSNLLWRDSGVHVVDLDDACNGPAVQDLWMLLSGERRTEP